MRSLRPLATACALAAVAGLVLPPEAAPQASPDRPPRPAASAAPGQAPIPLPSLPEEPAPTEQQLGIPVYPNAQYLRSYDAGRGQRFYLFGAQASFTEVVNYYRTMLRQRGELVFERPGTHAFETVRFREETMAFPPGVTVKDYAGTGSAGYPNPRPGGEPQRFATIIQIVPAPAGTAPAR